jgi:hypothetical protein
MRAFLQALAGLFVLLLVSHYGLSFFGDAPEEALGLLEWAKDATGLVLAVAVLFFHASSRDGQAA